MQMLSNKPTSRREIVFALWGGTMGASQTIAKTNSQELTERRRKREGE
jgi:hypothetical protein